MASAQRGGGVGGQGTSTGTGDITHDLGWNLLHQLLGQGEAKNALISPLSSYIAVGMVTGGADPARKTTLYEKLGVADEAQLQSTFAHLTRTIGANTIEGPLKLANAVFTDKSYTLSTAFKAHVASFEAEGRQFDNLPQAVQPINEWIAEHTRKMIPKMLTREALEGIHVAIVNALAFKGSWSKSFDPQYTESSYDFHATPDSTSKVEMMFRYDGGKVQTCNEDDFTAVRLPYKAILRDAQMHLIAYLPAEGTSVLSLLHKIRTNPRLAFHQQTYSKFGFPKMDIGTHTDLLDLLELVGLPLRGLYPAMGQAANGDPVEVGAVLHRAVMKLDESGTEAAAATVIIAPMGAAAPRAPPPALVFDRPFAFAIVAESIGAVVFNGIFAGA